MANDDICQKCKSAVANVKVTQIVNGKKKQWTLCENCARDHDELQQISAAPAFFKKFVENMFGKEFEKDSNRQCLNCKLTARAFEKSGLLGCEECYRTFDDELSVLLKRIHGSDKHIGSRPRPHRLVEHSPDPEALKVELRKAIERENFELAAKYRDMIRDMEREMQRQDQSSEKAK
jgi:protein arginine kinase activator